MVDSTTPENDKPIEKTELISDGDSDSRYSRTRLQGRGGTGRVWVAKDLRLDREVALKELIESNQERSRVRFLREARITSQLEHPAIIPIYELVTDDTSNPYYTMRLVRGNTLKEAIALAHKDQEDSILKSRLLRHFEDICNAIAYAHRNSIIHRDLKTANVVIGEFGETVVLDWGLAKNLDATIDNSNDTDPLLDSDRFDFTIEGKSIGTPSYMAPEQAEGRVEEIDERSDVYGLGAILYEILTGQPPFTGSSATKILADVVSRTPTPPEELNPHIPPALVSICNKCLNKNSMDRYLSVDLLCADIQRFMADERVSVHSERLSERTSRWIRQHKVLAASVFALMVSSVIGLSILNVLISQERENTASQRDRANELAVAANDERLKAIEQYQQAHATVDRYLDKVRASEFMNDPNLLPLQEELLQSALDYYEEFLQQESDEPVVMKELAEACYRVGEFNLALGRIEDAHNVLSRGEVLYEQLIGMDESALELQFGLGNILTTSGRSFAKQGNLNEAITEYDEAIQVFRTLHNLSPDAPEYAIELTRRIAEKSAALMETGKPALAETGYTEAMALVNVLQERFKELPDAREASADVLAGLGHLYSVEGRNSDAEMQFKQAVAIYDDLVQEYPQVVRYQDMQAGILTNIGLSRTADVGIKDLQGAIKIRRDLVDAHPEFPEYRHQLGHLLNTTSNVQQKLGDTEASLIHINEAREIYGYLSTRYPDIPEYHRSLASMHNQTGIYHFILKQHTTAVEQFKEGLVVAQRLYETHPEVFDYETLVAKIHYNLGLAYRQLRELESCVLHYGKAAEIYERSIERHPDRSLTVITLARTYNNMGNALRLLGLPEDATDSFRQAVEHYDRYTSFQVATPRDFVTLGNSQSNTGLMYRQLGDNDLAVKYLTDAVRSYNRVMESDATPALESSIRRTQAIIDSLEMQ